MLPEAGACGLIVDGHERNPWIMEQPTRDERHGMAAGFVVWHPWQKGNRYDDAWQPHAFHFERERRELRASSIIIIIANILQDMLGVGDHTVDGDHSLTNLSPSPSGLSCSLTLPLSLRPLLRKSCAVAQKLDMQGNRPAHHWTVTYSRITGQSIDHLTIETTRPRSPYVRACQCSHWPLALQPISWLPKNVQGKTVL